MDPTLSQTDARRQAIDRAVRKARRRSCVAQALSLIRGHFKEAAHGRTCLADTRRTLLLVRDVLRQAAK